VLVADAFRRHGWAVRALNVLQTAAAPNDYYGALFIDAKQIESTVQIGGSRAVAAASGYDAV
jgi:hypothetical protein